MTDELLRRIVAKGKARRAGKQSDAYRWLYTHHASMAVALATDPPEWRAIAEELTVGGIRGGRSRPLTDRAVKRIWQRVCRDIAAERVRHATGVRPTAGNRSRASATWRPEQVLVQQGRDAAAVPNSGQTWSPRSLPSDLNPGTMPGVVGPVSDEVVEARLAAFRRELDERSGR
jgi:hypothetical protein